MLSLNMNTHLNGLRLIFDQTNILTTFTKIIHSLCIIQKITSFAL